MRNALIVLGWVFLLNLSVVAKMEVVKIEEPQSAKSIAGAVLDLGLVLPSVTGEKRFDRAAIIKQPSKRSQIPHEAASAQRRTTRVQANPSASSSPNSSGLSFASAVSYASGGYQAISVTVVDVNGDGKPDLVVANACGSDSSCNTDTQGTVAVLLGNGDGTFQSAVSYNAGGLTSRSVAVADVNGDGKADLVVASECMVGNCANGVVNVLLGNGDGTFQPAVTYDSGGNTAESVALADVNGDGHPDIVVVNACTCTTNSTVAVLLGNGDGTFQPAVAYDSGGNAAVSLAIADVNGDGKPDLVIANACGSSIWDSSMCASSEAAGSVSVLQGNGDGTFQAAVTYGSGGYDATSVTVADVNGDGIPDLVVSNYCSDSPCDANGNVGVLFGNGDGTFQIAVPYDSGGAFAQSVAIADVNGDGKPDLLLANTFSNTVGVLLGNGDGTFQTAVIYGSGGDSADSVVAADVNGDGNADIVAANACQGGGVSGCTGNGMIGVLLDVPDFQIVASPTTVTVTAPGQSGSTTLTITPLGGFNRTVSYACSGLPSDANCSFANTSGGATLTITTVAPSARFHQTVSRGETVFYAMLLPGFLGLVSLGFKRTPRGMRLLALLCAVGFCSASLACGSSGGNITGSGTPAGTSTVIVTATAGSLSHQTAITLTVQ